MLTAAGLGLTIYLTVLVLPESGAAVVSLSEVYEHSLVGTRMMAGALLVLVSPLLLHLCARLLRIKFRRPGYFLTLLGVLLGALTYCLSFLPWPGLLAALVIPPICAFALFAQVLQIPLRQNLLLWSTKAFFMFLIFALYVWGYESAATGTVLNPIREIPAIYHTAMQAPGEPQSASLVTTEDPPVFLLIWPPSGSEWVDRRANRAQITVPTTGSDWHVEVVDRFKEPQGSRQGRGGFATGPVLVPTPDYAYFVHVSPTPESGVNGRVESLIPLKSQ